MTFSVQACSKASSTPALFASAGHCPLLKLTAGATCASQCSGNNGVPLGVLDDTDYEDALERACAAEQLASQNTANPSFPATAWPTKGHIVPRHTKEFIADLSFHLPPQASAHIVLTARLAESLCHLHSNTNPVEGWQTEKLTYLFAKRLRTCAKRAPLGIDSNVAAYVHYVSNRLLVAGGKSEEDAEKELRRELPRLVEAETRNDADPSSGASE